MVVLIRVIIILIQRWRRGTPLLFGGAQGVVDATASGGPGPTIPRGQRVTGHREISALQGLLIKVTLASVIALAQSTNASNGAKVGKGSVVAFIITMSKEIPEGPAGVATDSKLDEGAVKVTEKPEGRAIREGRAQSRRAKLQGTISLSAAVANNGIAPSAEVALWSPTKAIRARSQCGGLRVPQVLAGKPAIGRGHGLRDSSDNVGKQAGPKELMAGKGKPRVIKIHVVVGASIICDEVWRLIPDCCAPFEWRDKHGGPERGSELP
jgi:hypothetical protein